MDRDSGKDDRLPIHRGADHSSPYPVSRLAPGFGLVDLAHEIEQADQMVAGRLGAQLEVIAEQVRSLQAQARRILDRLVGGFRFLLGEVCIGRHIDFVVHPHDADRIDARRRPRDDCRHIQSPRPLEREPLLHRARTARPGFG